MDAVEVVLVNNDRVTLRVGDTFLKVDADGDRLAIEAEAMALAPVPTPRILWQQPNVLALEALRGAPLGVLGEAASAPGSTWRAVGEVLRRLHDGPLPERRGRSVEHLAARLDVECAWLVDSGVLPVDVVDRNRRLAETVLRPWTPALIHGDLHIAHVFVDGDEVTGIIDWSEAAQGDALFDLASLTLAHDEHLDDLVAGYGGDVDRDLLRAWWSMRCLLGVRWLSENGYGAPEDFPETAVLRSIA